MTITVRSNEAPLAAQADQQAPDSQSAPEAPKASEQNDSVESDPAETEGEDKADEAEAEDESQDESDAKDSSKEDKPKAKKGGFQRRIDKLNARAQAAQQEAEYWKERALKGAGESKHDAEKVESAAAKSDQAGKPDPEKFDTHAEYVEALTDWKLEQRERAKAQAEAQSKLKAEQDSLMKSHFEREKAFAEKNEDYAEAMEEAGYLADASAALSELIVSSEHGPALMYELAKDKAEYQRINRLAPLAAAREIGKLESRLQAASKSDASEPKEEPKKITKAPKPVVPVAKGGKGIVAKSLDDPNLSQAEYERLRMEQMKRKS